MRYHPQPFEQQDSIDTLVTDSCVPVPGTSGYGRTAPPLREPRVRTEKRAIRRPPLACPSRAVTARSVNGIEKNRSACRSLPIADRCQYLAPCYFRNRNGHAGCRQCRDGHIRNILLNLAYAGCLSFSSVRRAVCLRHHRRGQHHQRDDDSTKKSCLLYISPSPRDRQKSRLPSSA